MKYYALATTLFLIAVAAVGHDVDSSEWLHQVLMSVDPWLQRITWVGDGRVLIPFCIVWAFFLYVRRNKNFRGNYRAPLATLLAWAAAGAFVQGLKIVFGRPRPYLMHDPRYPNIDLGRLHWFTVDFDFASFPSGHATAVFAVAWCVARCTNTRRAKAVTLAVALLVATTRVALAKHFFADTLAGAAIGIAFGELLLNRLSVVSRV